MSYADPQSVTLAAPLPVGAVSLPRVNTDGATASYTSADGLITLSTANQLTAGGTRARRLLRIDYAKIGADVFLPAQNVKQSMSAYLVFDVPKIGFTNAEIKAVYTAWKGNFTASTDLNIDKLIAGES